MKNTTKQLSINIILGLCVLLFSTTIQAQTTSFTYQGRLSDNNLAANGIYDMQFALFDAVSGGNQISSTITNANVSVVNGIFTVNLDFGANSFSGANRFLEIGVRVAGNPNPHTILNPRQPVTSAPYSIKSLNSSTADNANQLGGIDANQYVTGQVVKSLNNLNNDVTLAAGSNITITPVGNTLTIASTGGGGSGGILNQTSLQTGANFNIDGNGKAAIFDATQFNINGRRAFALSFFAGGGFTNTFLGDGSGENNPTGFENTFIGRLAGNANLDGSQNTAVGAHAGENSVLVSGSSFFGALAGRNSNGSQNTFIGSFAGLRNTVGISNTTLGADSDVGSNNLFNANAIGYKALVNQNNSMVLGSISNVNGAVFNTNVGIGTTTPSARFHIFNRENNGEILFGNGGCSNGFGVIGFSPNFTDCTGYALRGNASDTFINRSSGSIFFRLGNETQMTLNQNGTLAINTLGSGGSTQLCRNGSNQISTCSSSLRYKTNIASFSSGLSLVNRLQPITFNWKDGDMQDLGLGAEDVAAIEPLLVTYNDKGEVEGVKYDRIGVVLLNAVKEQQTQIELLKQIVCQDHPNAEVCK
ncbi:MAG: tail fiber domain-containing protein [Pyrinomonadaceae bacterium]|nr:tail fiber domain-containing protein [Pyrinomonadaceae bacterium]